MSTDQPIATGIVPEGGRVSRLLDPTVIKVHTHLAIPEHLRLFLKRECTRLGITDDVPVHDFIQSILYRGVHSYIVETQQKTPDDAHAHLSAHIDELNQIQKLLADFQ
ncbi:MAG: hypothetical protein KGL39_17145 [Patescibacteria group bacterium]|nr:hypothetical protein [Patescibacteria group bacterium]